MEEWNSETFPEIPVQESQISTSGRAGSRHSFLQWVKKIAEKQPMSQGHKSVKTIRNNPSFPREEKENNCITSKTLLT